MAKRRKDAGTRAEVALLAQVKTGTKAASAEKKASEVWFHKENKALRDSCLNPFACVGMRDDYRCSNATCPVTKKKWDEHFADELKKPEAAQKGLRSYYTWISCKHCSVDGEVHKK